MKTSFNSLKKAVNKGLVLIFLITILTFSGYGQGGSSSDPYPLNTISTAVPFLRIAPDARSGAMGDVGIAISPDANSLYWNPSKIAFAERELGLNASYTPWLRSLVNDIYLANLAGYKRIDKNQTIGLSLLYFYLGDIQFTNSFGVPIGDFTPHEFAVSTSYARRLSDRLSAGLALKFIYSNLAAGQFVNSIPIHSGKAFAADISMYYQNDVELGDYNANFAFGANISNLGTKITYSESALKDFIPINLGIGTALEIELDAFNNLTFAFDINKLLVPTPDPADSLNTAQNMSVTSGVLGSFTDAPGGFVEEMHELMYSFGIEYWYSNQFAVRAGYFNEHHTKGNRKYLTAGLGLKFNVFGLNVSYLIPSNSQRNPLDNTLRFTLVFDFSSFNNDIG